MSYQICNFASGHPLDMVLVSSPRFLSMGNTLGTFSEASDRFECQELGGVAIIGPGVLQEVKLLMPSGQSKASENGLMLSCYFPFPKTLVLSPEPCL